MSALPWSERVTAMSIHGEMAGPRDVERLASELMDAEARLARLRLVVRAAMQWGGLRGMNLSDRAWALGEEEDAR
jgi:hypothetical protein